VPKNPSVIEDKGVGLNATALEFIYAVIRNLIRKITQTMPIAVIPLF